MGVGVSAMYVCMYADHAYLHTSRNEPTTTQYVWVNRYHQSHHESLALSLLECGIKQCVVLVNARKSCFSFLFVSSTAKDFVERTKENSET